MYKRTKIVMMIILSLMISSCVVSKHVGIVKVEDLHSKTSSIKKEVKPFTDKHVLQLNPKIKEAVSKFKDDLIKKAKIKLNVKQSIAINKRLTESNKLIRLTNIKELGVIDITSRLSKRLTKKKNISKDKYYVMRDNPEEDKFGGKLICNEEVLILRLDRSKLIKCMEKGRADLPFDWKTFLVNYRFINVVNFKKHFIHDQCKTIHAVSLNAYHNLASCLIRDKQQHGLFKYRNINSFGVKFHLIKGK